MGFTNYVSENEAMSYCGVTAKTLARFAEAGYLSVEKESDGLKLYSSEELEKVFGVTVQRKTAKPSEAAPHRTEESSSLRDSSLRDSSLRNSIESSQSNSTDTNEPLAEDSNKGPFPAEFAKTHPEERSREREIEPEKNRTVNGPEMQSVGATDTATGTATGTQPNNIQAIGVTSNNESHSSATSTQTDGSIQPPEPSYSAGHSPHLQALLEMEREETARLRSRVEKLERINEVNEKIIELREERIKEVNEERTWLRERVERLEEKAERDQLVLLSETQLLKQMLITQTQKSSPVRAALEWIGLVEPKQPELFPVKGTVEGQTVKK